MGPHVYATPRSSNCSQVPSCGPARLQRNVSLALGAQCDAACAEAQLALLAPELGATYEEDAAGVPLAGRLKLASGDVLSMENAAARCGMPLLAAWQHAIPVLQRAAGVHSCSLV